MRCIQFSTMFPLQSRSALKCYKGRHCIVRTKHLIFQILDPNNHFIFGCIAQNSEQHDIFCCSAVQCHPYRTLSIHWTMERTSNLRSQSPLHIFQQIHLYIRECSELIKIQFVHKSIDGQNLISVQALGSQYITFTKNQHILTGIIYVDYSGGRTLHLHLYKRESVTHFSFILQFEFEMSIRL